MSLHPRQLCDVPAEAAVLSTLLLEPARYTEVSAILRASDYYHEAHRIVHRSVGQLLAEGRAVDVLTLATSLRETGMLDRVGGTPYLAQLIDATPSVSNVVDHARIVAGLAERRRIAESGERLAIMARGGEPIEEIRTAVGRLGEVVAPLAPEKQADTIASVLAGWSAEGPLVHEPTGIPSLDELTGGGPVYGTRWYVSGAPDASKTLLLVLLAHVWALRGVTVGFLAVDEEPADLVARFAQRKGWRRSDTESRHSDTLDAMGDALGSLPVRFYDSTWTIESAAENLHKAANGGRAALLIDSVQTVQCEAERLAKGEMSEVAAVTARTRAIRRAASRYHIITVSTSELGRASYASEEARRNVSTMAGGKWSGAIEYSARVLIGLRSVAGEPDLIDLEIAKNKHGPRDQHVYLRIDRASQSLWPVEYEPEPEESRGGRRDERAQDRVRSDAETVVAVLQQHGGIGVRELRAQVRATCGAGVERVEAALAYLGGAVIRGKGPRNSTPLSLDISNLPSDWRDRV